MTTTSNAERARQYLAAVASLESAERVSEFFASDGVFQEFPNRIAPTGVFAMRPTCERPSSEVARSSNRRATVSRNVVEAGDEVAIELVWTGVLAAPVLSLAAGTEMKAFVAMFLTFRDGKIVSQRNYDCYPPFERTPDPAVTA